MSAIQLNADTFRTQVLEQKQPALVEFMGPLVCVLPPDRPRL